MNFRQTIMASAVALAAMGASAAYADTYDFTFLSLDGVYSINDGVFTTDASNNILSASGDLTAPASELNGVTSASFTLATPASSDNNDEAYDNIYDPVNNDFSGNGVGLLLADGAGDDIATIYLSSGYCAPLALDCLSVSPTANAGDGNWNPGDPGTLTITAVPEPATWAMLLLGFFGIGFMMRGSRRKDAVAVA